MKDVSVYGIDRARRNQDTVLTDYENETFTRSPLRYLDGKSMKMWGSGYREYDGHRQKMYDAERVVKGHGERFKDKSGIRKYLDYITDLKSFQRRFKVDSSDIRIRIKKANARRSSARWNKIKKHHMDIAPNQMQEFVVLHELSHILAPPPHAPHGRLFSAIQLWLVGSRMNMREELLESYRNHNLPYSPHRSVQIPSK